MIEKRLSNDLAAFAFTQSPIAMMILDEHATVLNINCTFEQLTGYNEIDCLGKTISFFDSDKNLTPLDEICIEKKIHAKDENHFETYIRSKNGEHVLVRTQLKIIIYEDKRYLVCTLQDIEEEKRMLEHYRHLAMHDALTGLANRLLLEDRFEMAEHRATRHQQKMALLLCDINGFKAYNDQYGHDFGDEVLRSVAKRLESLLRRNDIVCRYGGDEFVLILEDITHGESIAQIVTTIKDAFPITVTYGDKSSQVSMSIGSACYPQDGRTFHQLIQVADQKMYQAKNSFYKEG